MSSDTRRPYEKPQVMRLEYSTDVAVTMQTPCKTTTSGNGSGGQGSQFCFNGSTVCSGGTVS